MSQIPVRPAATSGIDSDTLSVRAVAAIEPSSELLDRALAGWERFLGTFETTSDE
ncbi:hypothetical protein OOK31_23445 [Streptomyces sp. NBC_00249]|uniref:hypothetical protein n=1 Tax=Streptomyces sp. NBC_00249 TaxID=2975690 RepID=UPI0022500AB4|nr:hypothetical protein [Streptomyces sp. NBC_00249]MCX5196812.1 hypothetical protein [Streptomyces sp. NBC_00249]